MNGDKQQICDSFVGVLLNTPLKGLPELPDDMKVAMVDVTKVIPKNNGEILELPDVAKLKAYIKIQKTAGNQRIMYDFGEGCPIVDAQHLLDVMELLPNTTAHTTSQMSPIRFDSESGVGVCMPINPNSVTCARGKTEI